MTNFNLGDKFDTSNVTNMEEMFLDFGYTLTSLDLGDKFNTAKVQDMTRMFQNCGQTSMTSLDLGAAFTKIAPTNTDFMTNCGTSSLKIYAPEAIYSNREAFK